VETLETLRTQIETAEELHAVVGTMKSLSAVSRRQYEIAVASLDTFVRVNELGFSVLLRRYPHALVVLDAASNGLSNRQMVSLRSASVPVFSADRIPDVTARVMISFGSDMGLCGSLNRRVVSCVGETLRESAFGMGECLHVAVGSRLARELEAAGYSVMDTFDLPGSAEGITDRVNRLLQQIDVWRTAGLQHLLLCHVRPGHSVLSYEPSAFPLLPFATTSVEEAARTPWPTRMLPDFALDWRVLLAALVRQRLFILLHRAFAESMAGLHASRFRAMAAAEQNLEERLGDLRRSYHRRRQAVVTEELFDVIAGFEVMR